MESTDQVLEEQSTMDQPEVGKSDEAGKLGQSQTFNVNGQDLTGDQLLENYKKLQGEYTKSRQELSETKKHSELSEEDQRALEFIKKNGGFVTKDDLDNMSRKQAQESRLKDILAANPDLKQFEGAIKQLGSSGEMAYEDIIEKYGFKTKDKLAKARTQGDIKGMPEAQAKSISQMSDDEYEKYRAKMGIGTRGSFS